jgi:hypothetical protein
MKTDKISQQPENCENRNDPDLVQAFLKKWWVESDYKAPNLPLGNFVITLISVSDLSLLKQQSQRCFFPSSRFEIKVSSLFVLETSFRSCVRVSSSMVFSCFSASSYLVLHNNALLSSFCNFSRSDCFSSARFVI